MTLEDLKTFLPMLLDYEVVKYETGKLQNGQNVYTIVLVQQPSAVTRVVPLT